MPLQRYVATVTLKPVTDGDRTFWHWESTFATPPGLERELRDMVAQDVYEAGFENLRRYLRDGGDRRGARRRGRDADRLADALAPAPSSAATAAPTCCSPATARRRRPSAGEVRIRQRAIGINYLDVYLRSGWIPPMLPLPGVPGMEAAGTVVDVGAGVSGLLPGDRVAYLGPVPGAYCSVRTVPADWVVRLPAAVEDEVAAATAAQGHHRRLPAARPRPRRPRHAAAGACGGRRRRPAGLRLGAPARRDRDRHGVERGQGARRARRTAASIRSSPADYRFAEAVQARCGGADVVIDGLGDAARDENLAALARRGHWISLGQASGPLQPLSRRRAGGEVADLLAPGGVRLRREPRPTWPSAPPRVWQALADGTLAAAADRAPCAGRRREAHRRLESRRTIGALVLIA